MNAKTVPSLLAALTVLVALILLAFLGASVDAAQDVGEDRTEERLLRASEGLQYPGSESDSAWTFVSYEGFTKLPDAATFEQTSGCPVTEQGVTSRLDFDATLGRLGAIQPWMDEGQRKSARGFARLGKLFHREFGDDLAVYRCETGAAEVYLYFIGVDEDRLAGLLTISIET
ncbi:MAG: nuclease A inhibitor family protein [Rubrobacteraceae bacterium]